MHERRSHTKQFWQLKANDFMIFENVVFQLCSFSSFKMAHQSGFLNGALATPVEESGGIRV